MTPRSRVVAIVIGVGRDEYRGRRFGQHLFHGNLGDGARYNCPLIVGGNRDLHSRMPNSRDSTPVDVQWVGPVEADYSSMRILVADDCVGHLLRRTGLLVFTPARKECFKFLVLGTSLPNPFCLDPTIASRVGQVGVVDKKPLKLDHTSSKCPLVIGSQSSRRVRHTASRKV